MSEFRGSRNVIMESEIATNVEVIGFSLRNADRSESASVPLLYDLISSVGLDQIGPNASHFVYTLRIHVTSPTVRTWDVQKRFSELAALDDSLSGMTKCLPYFPPRGAKRDLDDSCAKDRQRLLNEYFAIITRMREVVHSQEFMSFFHFDSGLRLLIPNKVAEIFCEVSAPGRMAITAIGLSSGLLAVGVSSAPTLWDKMGKYVGTLLQRASRADESSLVLFKKLPNSYLYEKLVVDRFQFRILSILVSPSNCVVFSTSDGRVGIKWLGGDFLDRDQEAVKLLQSGEVAAMSLDDEKTFLWTGGSDGQIQKFNLTLARLELRVNSNCEPGIAASAILAKDLLYVGFSNGIVSIFQPTGIRLVTILQGPCTSIVSLILVEKVLFATHTSTLLQSDDGANCVQAWDVADVLTRGTRKLPQWGPSASPCVSAMGISGGSDQLLAICMANGAVCVIEAATASRAAEACSGILVNRSKWLLHAFGSIASAAYEADALFIACGLGIQVWKLPPFEDHLEMIDLSSLELCQSVRRLPPNQSSSETVPETEESDDDLRSWART